MGNVVIDMSMSLDGYIAAPNDNPGRFQDGRKFGPGGGSISAEHGAIR